MSVAALLLLAAWTCVSHAAEVYFFDKFDSPAWEQRWTVSNWKPGEMGRWGWSSGRWFVDEAENKGIQTLDDMKYHAISAKLDKEFTNKGKTLVVQFSVKHEQKEYSFCGGGYIKLLQGIDQATFGGDTDYQIMFGPDICSYDVSRIQAIFTNTKREHLLRTEEIKLEYDDKNEFTHLYTWVVNPDNTYQVYFDLKEKASGNVVDDWDFPKKSYDDPADKKPSDWVDEAEMDDPEAKQPDDWVVEQQIRDPDAKKPDEWDDELDGQWEAPWIDNPDFKGEWKAERIPNPNYKGEWKARQVPNPDYKEDVVVYDFAYVGFELWIVNNGSIYDNILICDDFEYAKEVAEKAWRPTSEKEKDVQEKWKKANEEAQKEEPKEEEEAEATVEAPTEVKAEL